MAIRFFSCDLQTNTALWIFKRAQTSVLRQAGISSDRRNRHALHYG
jgi:hypothetical protein